MFALLHMAMNYRVIHSNRYSSLPSHPNPAIQSKHSWRVQGFCGNNSIHPSVSIYSSSLVLRWLLCTANSTNLVHSVHSLDITYPCSEPGSGGGRGTSLKLMWSVHCYRFPCGLGWPKGNASGDDFLFTRWLARLLSPWNQDEEWTWGRKSEWIDLDRI